jgi:Protein of unknown function DUF72
LYVVEAKKERAVGLPKPTLATVFEVVTTGRVYRVTGAALQRWIVEKRSSRKRTEGDAPYARSRGWNSDGIQRRGRVIRVGPAGWNYYPKPAPRGFDELAYIATYFTTVEINSSFYGPPHPGAARK